MVKMKSRRLARQKGSKVDRRGIPQILVAARSEPLNDPLSLKLWPSVARYIEQHGGPNFVRSAIIEKLQRIADKPVKAVCAQCSHLTKQDGDYFCSVILGFLNGKLLNQKFSCDYFSPRKEAKCGG